MRILLTTIVLAGLLAQIRPAVADEIDLPDLTGFYRSGPRPATERVMEIDLTHYQHIESIRFELAGTAYPGTLESESSTEILEGCISIWFDYIDLNHPHDWVCALDGEFCVALDSFRVSSYETVQDWSFLAAAPRNVSVYVSTETVQTPVVYPTAVIDSVTLIVDGVVPNERTTWGALKSLY